MPANLSIKNVPDELLDQLRDRAKGNHRSLQGELLSILEEALSPPCLNIENLHKGVRKLGLLTSAESAKMVREDRSRRF